MTRLPRFSRHQEVQRVKNELEFTGFPRVQMLLLVAVTGLTGLGTSYAFLHLGLTDMWLRYLISFGVAYLMFLLLLWAWLRSHGDAFNDFPDLSGLDTHSSSCAPDPPGFSGHGGEFGGAGASGSFGDPVADVPVSGDSGLAGDALSSVAGADEFVIQLSVIVLIGALLLSALMVVYSAPTLFAELIVDGVLSASLYRRLRGLRTQHWLQTAIRHTAWPFALSAVVVSAAGFAMSCYAPEAHTLGDVLVHAKHHG